MHRPFTYLLPNFIKTSNNMHKHLLLAIAANVAKILEGDINMTVK